jgi:hypothetical protein
MLDKEFLNKRRVETAEERSKRLVDDITAFVMALNHD